MGAHHSLHQVVWVGLREGPGLRAARPENIHSCRLSDPVLEQKQRSRLAR